MYGNYQYFYREKTTYSPFKNYYEIFGLILLGGRIFGLFNGITKMFPGNFVRTKTEN